MCTGGCPREPLDLGLTAQLRDFAGQHSDWKIALSLLFWGKTLRLIIIILTITLHAWVFSLLVCLCTMCMSCPTEVKNLESPGTGIMGDQEPPRGCWELMWIL